MAIPLNKFIKKKVKVRKRNVDYLVRGARKKKVKRSPKTHCLTFRQQRS